MSSTPPAPTTILTGALGVGKTTTILRLLAAQPADANWAILVNEFGEVGIDGAILADGGVAVREIPGGCICCTAGVALQVALVRLLRDLRPTRLIIEPTGLAHPASVIDILRRPGLRDSVDLRATVTLIDPRHLEDPRVRELPSFQDQVEAGDVLVASKTDLCTQAQLESFQTFAAQRWPPPLRIAHMSHGELDPTLIDLDPKDHSSPRPPAPHAHPLEAPLGGTAHRLDQVETCGWTWPAQTLFDRQKLREVIQDLVRPCEALPQGVLRLKGLFRTPGAWLLVHADADAVRFTPSGWRRDSRVEIIAPTSPSPDWHAVGDALGRAQR
ncbi:MAG: GTP-binding protein [Deltaproteobacteria bacterium]|nr:MAG: GTP-binding protein [Deltaproteobacteria bacterium]